MTPEQKGLLTRVKIEASRLLTPVWPPLAAPMRSHSYQASPPEERYILRLFDDDLRLAFCMTGHEPALIRLVASLRSSSTLGKVAASVAYPVDGGWKAVAETTINDGSREAVEKALLEIRAQLHRIPAINRKVSQQARHLSLSDWGNQDDLD
jgi:hypothetical protein